MPVAFRRELNNRPREDTKRCTPLSSSRNCGVVRIVSVSRINVSHRLSRISHSPSTRAAATACSSFGNRRDIAVHGVHEFKADELRASRIRRPQLVLEIPCIVVPKDPLFSGTIADALDHRGMIVRVRKYEAAWNLAAQRRQRGFVCNVARCKKQCRFLVMEVTISRSSITW
jgi:hypothetical protein